MYPSSRAGTACSMRGGRIRPTSLLSRDCFVCFKGPGGPFLEPLSGVLVSADRAGARRPSRTLPEADMDRDLQERGLAVRRKVLGARYVDQAMQSADAFNLPLQE